MFLFQGFHDKKRTTSTPWPQNGASDKAEAEDWPRGSPVIPRAWTGFAGPLGSSLRIRLPLFPPLYMPLPLRMLSVIYSRNSSNSSFSVCAQLQVGQAQAPTRMFSHRPYCLREETSHGHRSQCTSI